MRNIILNYTRPPTATSNLHYKVIQIPNITTQTLKFRSPFAGIFEENSWLQLSVPYCESVFAVHFSPYAFVPDLVKNRS